MQDILLLTFFKYLNETQSMCSGVTRGLSLGEQIWLRGPLIVTGVTQVWDKRS